uniref:Folylpolyglutamate synthase n=1 Tax=Plectus sambesii TaxID=2011161 RepID=A0A914WLB9_9BILA
MRLPGRAPTKWANHLVNLHTSSRHSTGVALTPSAMSTHKTASYENAIFQLNSLQSNASVIQQLRKKREIHPERNLMETEMFLERAAIQITDLDKLNVIHVSGTKGKGSTCAFTESVLRELGFKTGFYSSPHLVHVRERIRINGEPLNERDFARYFWTVYKRLEKSSTKEETSSMPAYFKFLTLMAYHVFVEEKVDVAIIEVGIGGEYDCTNVIKNPVVCGVTTLDYDHTSILGQTLEEIAWHKAGIFKPGSVAITADWSPETLGVLESRAKERQCPLSLAPALEAYEWPGSRLEIGIPGQHQYWNITLAMQLSRVWLERTGRSALLNDIPIIATAPLNKPNCTAPVLPGFQVSSAFVQAIRSCRWPGRSQVLRRGRITYFLDGAHTPKSLECCAKWFKSESLVEHDGAEEKPIKMLLFHCTADRSADSLLPYLQKCNFDYALFCPTQVHARVDRRSDQANLNQDEHAQLDKCEQNRKCWTQLQRGKSSAGVTEVLPCIEDALNWIESRDQHLDALKGGLSTTNVHVLVTGSLHLVGGVIGLIDPELKMT